jgi:hypothetical protein
MHHPAAAAAKGELEVADLEQEVVVALAATLEVDEAVAASTKVGEVMEVDSRHHHHRRIVIHQSDPEIKVVVQEEKEAVAVPDVNEAVVVAEPPHNKSENSKLNESAKKTRRRGPLKLLL